MGVNNHVGYTALDRARLVNAALDRARLVNAAQAATRPMPPPAPPASHYHTGTAQTKSSQAGTNKQEQDIIGDALAFGALFGL